MLTNDQAVDVHPSYINNDKAILFSSDRNGVYNIYKLDVAQQTLQQMTHVLAGAFMSAVNNNALFYVGYGEGGNNIYKLETDRSIKTESIAMNISVDIKKDGVSSQLDLDVSDYSPWSSMRPRWWEPMISITEEKKEIGFATFAHDALAMHNYFMSLAYDSQNSLVTGSATYSYIDRLVIGVARESSVLSDVGGNYVATITKDDYFLYWTNPLRKLESSWNFIVGAQAGVNKEWRRESWIAPINDFNDKQAGMALTFTNTKKYIRSISESDGRKLKLVYENSDVWNSDYSGDVYTLDWREFMQINNQHLLAIRLSEGWGTDAPENFRLGGEDNDYKLLDFIGPLSEAVFGEREYTLRGYPEGLAQLSGRRMQLASIEWRFPLGLIERGLMAPPVGLIQWSGSVFMDSGATWNNGSSPDNYYSSAGFEIHADVTLGYRLNTHMRLGFASGLDDVIGEDRVYFSLGASF